MTVSKSQKVKNLTLGDVMCLAHMICWLSETKKNNKRLKVFVLVAVYVPEEPDVYENKDMLCSGHCVCVDVFFLLLFFTKQLVTQEKLKFRMLNL